MRVVVQTAMRGLLIDLFFAPAQFGEGVMGRSSAPPLRALRMVSFKAGRRFDQAERISSPPASAAGSQSAVRKHRLHRHAVPFQKSLLRSASLGASTGRRTPHVLAGSWCSGLRKPRVPAAGRHCWSLPIRLACAASDHADHARERLACLGFRGSVRPSVRAGRKSGQQASANRDSFLVRSPESFPLRKRLQKWARRPERR